MTPVVLTSPQLALLESLGRLDDEYAGNQAPELFVARELEGKGVVRPSPVGTLPVWTLTPVGSVALQMSIARALGD